MWVQHHTARRARGAISSEVRVLLDTEKTHERRARAAQCSPATAPSSTLAPSPRRAGADPSPSPSTGARANARSTGSRAAGAARRCACGKTARAFRSTATTGPRRLDAWACARWIGVTIGAKGSAAGADALAVVARRAPATHKALRSSPLAAAAAAALAAGCAVIVLLECCRRCCCSRRHRPTRLPTRDEEAIEDESDGSI